MTITLYDALRSRRKHPASLGWSRQWMKNSLLSVSASLNMLNMFLHITHVYCIICIYSTHIYIYIYVHTYIFIYTHVCIYIKYIIWIYPIYIYIVYDLNPPSRKKKWMVSSTKKLSHFGIIFPYVPHPDFPMLQTVDQHEIRVQIISIKS
jgi:hypothetical protein